MSDEKEFEEPFMYKCPFCFDPGIEFIKNPPDEQWKESHQSKCHRCGAMGPKSKDLEACKKVLLALYKKMHDREM